MAYRADPDLNFLGNCSDEDLIDLVHCLTADKDGGPILTETLTISDEYKSYKTMYSKYWQRIAEEIQLFGGNSFANMLRGGDGVLYKEILCDVCEKLDVNFNRSSDTSLIESYLFQKILRDAFSEMSDEEKKSFLRDFMEENQYININNITPQLLNGVAQAAFKAGGFASYKMAVYIANMVWKKLFGTGLSIAANSTITKWLSIWAGPIGWTVTGIWTAIDIAGPAFRVTIPVVIQVAMLRQKKLYDQIQLRQD